MKYVFYMREVSSTLHCQENYKMWFEGNSKAQKPRGEERKCSICSFTKAHYFKVITNFCGPAWNVWNLAALNTEFKKIWTALSSLIFQFLLASLSHRASAQQLFRSPPLQGLSPRMLLTSYISSDIPFESLFFLKAPALRLTQLCENIHLIRESSYSS